MAGGQLAEPKKVVYLWGAGATHAESLRLGATTSLLMRDTAEFGEGITTRILRRLGADAVKAYGSAGEVDIEKLISLLTSSGVQSHVGLAEEMRKAYFLELLQTLDQAKVLEKPALATTLLSMHLNEVYCEKTEILKGIITTNHDGLLQVASHEIHDAVNIGCEYESCDFEYAKSAPPILQLHGSFTWQFGLPMRINKLKTDSIYENTVWIPPTILKESKSYPFNKFSGMAYEILSRQCDVLRVVGASLTQNDWNILSLIFNAQRHREFTKGTAFQIELIMPPKAGQKVKRECGYLQRIRSIGALTDGNFSEYQEYEVWDGPDVPPDSDLANPFSYWLNEKILFHKNRGELAADFPDLSSPKPGEAE